MAGNTVYVQGSYVDVHDNEVVNLSIDTAGKVVVGSNGQQAERHETRPDVVQQALSKCGAYIWGNAAYTVAFCVCRDELGWQDNASYFERQMEQRGIPLPQGTINATMSRNPYMKLKVDKWDDNGAMERVLRLRDEFRLQMALLNGGEDKP